MSKRPLCLLFLLLCLWIVGSRGFQGEILSKETSLQIEKIEKKKELVVIKGLVYKGEIKNQKNLIYLRNSILEIQSQTYQLKNVIVEIPDSSYYSIGMEVMAKGNLYEIKSPTNPGEFHLKNYYEVFSIGCRMKAKKIETTNAKYSYYGEFLRRIRIYASYNLKKIAPKKEAGLIEAMVLGTKSDLEDTTKSLFQVTGTLHVLVISGLHISLLGLGCYHLLEKLKWNQTSAAAASSGFLISYAILTGYAPATLRAMLMFLVKILGRKWGRTYDALSALAFSALLILLKNPNYLFYSGFWLSNLAVVGVGLWKEKYEKKSQMNAKNRKAFWKEQVKKQVFPVLKAYLGSQMLIFPILLYMYGEVYPYGILMNLLFLPAMSFLLLFGLLGISFSFLWVPLGEFIMSPAVFLLNIYMKMMETIQKLPFSSIIIGSPPLWFIFFYYGGLCGLLYLIKIKRKKVSVLFFLLPILLFFRPACDLKITNLDVGQGDACLIQVKKNLVCMVDGGSSSKEKIGERILIPFLKHEGISHIHYMIVTHPDEDHYNGVVEILDLIAKKRLAVKVDYLLLPCWENENATLKMLKSMAESAKIQVRRVGRGDSILEDNTKTKIEILHPDGENYLDKTNEGSIVFALKQGDFRGVFTGDIEGISEKKIVESIDSCEYLKVAHHGSKGASSREFLDKASPKVSVISCGKNNKYGHPSKEALERIKEVGSHVLRTDELGAVWMERRGENNHYFTFLQSEK